MPKTILMVDDDSIQLEMYGEIFAPYYTTLLAGSFRKAIEILENQHVDAVGCDLHVGVDDGRDILAWIGRNKPEMLKKSVLISGDKLTDLNDLEVLVLFKPVQMPTLLETFKQFLS